MLTAHYGVVLAQLHAAFGTWHFGGPEYFIAQHEQLDIVVHAVDGGYYALIASRTPADSRCRSRSRYAAAHRVRRAAQGDGVTARALAQRS